MFAGDVYYCCSCDAHCRAVSTSQSAPCCPRCQEPLSEDCRLDAGPTLLTLFSRREERTPTRPAATSSPGLWPTRAAAMH